MRTARLGILAFAAMLLSALARAELPPWSPEAGVPLNEDVQSLEITQHDAPLFMSPEAKAARRGSAQLAARLPILGWTRGNAPCQGRWFLVGPQAWICESYTRLSTWPVSATGQNTKTHDGLPYAYHFVGSEGSFGYATLGLADEGIPDSQLEPGFAVAVRQIERKPGGELYGLSTHGLWLPMRDLRPTTGSSFRGQAVPDGNLTFGWTYKAQTAVHSKPNRRIQNESLRRHTLVEIGERRVVYKRAWLQIGPDRWLPEVDVRQPRTAPAPVALRHDERWIHVNTESQTLVAYRGQLPVFATLVSTGKGAPGSIEATPSGEHRIWVKLESTDMTNLEDEYANRYYAIEEVPWVMFFKQGYGLHGAFWHDDFGNKRSHGCVNLSPLDAEWLFGWAGPEEPQGWRATHPTVHDPGTMVVVR